MRTIRSSFPLLVLIVLALDPVSGGNIPRASLNEIARRADLIFIGTVARQDVRFAGEGKSIITDVLFENVRIIHAGPASKQHASPSVTLSYPGGTVGVVSMSTSAMPHFRTGGRYLVFTRDDGESYINPIVGGPQGKFEIIKDPQTGTEYLLSASGRGMLRSDQPEPTFTHDRISTISSGIPHVQSSGQIVPSIIPVSIPHDSLSTSSAFRSTGDDSFPLMDLEEFLTRIRNTYLTVPPNGPVLKLEGVGMLYRRDGNVVIRDDLRAGSGGIDLSLSSLVVPTDAGEQIVRADAPLAYQAAVLGGTLGCGGYHDLKLVMEQVPKSWWTYGVQNDCMWTWNQFVDVYWYSDDDGTYQWLNSSNEFVGFLTDAALYQEYHYHWNGYLAMVCTWRNTTTGAIYESDLMYNATYNWTPNAEIAIGDTNVVSIRPVTMHELGHTWGEQVGDFEETYDYDVPSVMHARYAYMVEDGWGIHAVDAKLFRENYRSQSPPTSIKDVGVESYRASGRLIPAAIARLHPSPGSTIELQGVTVENMSSSAMSDVRIRFYLSTDRTITTSDYQMGTYWSWSSFPAESHTVETYTCTIPEDVPVGTYYVGAIVTINGYESDDYQYNNATSFLNPITIFEPLTISGRVLEAGTAVGLGNVVMEGLPGNPTTDAEGRYSVVVPYLWGGFVRPSSPTHSFTPQWTSYSNVVVSQQTGYAGNINTIPVSGYVLTSGGAGIAGVTLTGLPSPPVTAANGAYVRMVSTGWSGVVKPVKASHRFSPDSVVLTNVTSLQSCWFTGTKVEFTISGQISVGTRVFLEGAVMNGLPGDPVTDINGRYSAVVDSGWSGTATPTKLNYIFTPPSVAYANVVETPSTKLSSYSAQLRPLSISGSVRTSGGAAIAGVTMGGLPRTPVTDSTGRFIDTVNFFWDGHVQPAKTGYSFTPYNVIMNKLAQDTVLSYVGIGPPASVSLTVATYPAGLRVIVDDSVRFGPYTIQTLEGTSHKISADSVYSTGFGSRARWILWLDGRARTHTVVPTRDTIFVAIHAGENELNVSALPPEGGITQPSGSKWWSPTHRDTVRATPNSGYAFVGWEGDVLGSENPIVVSLDRPKMIVAKFEPISGIAGKETVMEFSLGQAYPNPFNPSAMIEYALPVRGHVTLEVFDMLGTRRSTVVDEPQEAGHRHVRFDADGLSSGVYFYRLTVVHAQAPFVATRRMVFLR